MPAHRSLGWVAVALLLHMQPASALEVSDTLLIVLVVAAVVGAILALAALVLWCFLTAQRREETAQEHRKAEAAIARAVGDPWAASIAIAQLKRARSQPRSVLGGSQRNLLGPQGSLRSVLSSVNSFRRQGSARTGLAATPTGLNRQPSTRSVLSRGSLGDSLHRGVSGTFDAGGGFCLAPDEYAPGVPTVTKVTANMIVLCWEPPADEEVAARVHHYKVRFKAMRDKDFSLNTHNHNPTFTVRGMPPGTRLDHIRTSAVLDSKHGEETEESRHVFAVTLDVPSCPTGLRGTGLTPSSVLLLWQTPQFSGRCDIQRYVIRYECEGNHTMFSTHNAATSCAIDDLPPNAAVEHVTVAAVNEVGESPRCVELACVRPLEAAVPQLHLVATRPGEVEVEWQLPSDAPSQPSTAPRHDSRTSGGGSSLGGTSNSVDLSAHVGLGSDHESKATAPSRQRSRPQSLPPLTTQHLNDTTKQRSTSPSMSLGPSPRSPGLASFGGTSLWGDVGQEVESVASVTVPAARQAPPPSSFKIFYTQRGAVHSLDVPGTARHFVLEVPPGEEISDLHVCGVDSSGTVGPRSNALDAIRVPGNLPPPTDVRVTHAGADVVVVQWTPPDVNGITHYIVTCSVNGDAKAYTASGTTTCRLSSLPMGCSVDSITVRAVIDGVSTPPSLPISANTKHHDDPPRNLRVTARTATTVALAWEPPLDDTLSFVAYYVVRYTDDHGVQHAVDTGSVGTSFVVGGGTGEPQSNALVPGTQLFDVSVHAVTTKDTATRASDTIQASTLLPPAAVRNLTMATVGPKSVALSWQLPPAATHRATITSLAVQYSVNGGAAKRALVPASATKHVIQGLPPHACVTSILVTPKSAVGPGDVAELRGRELPSAPRWLKVEPVTAPGGAGASEGSGSGSGSGSGNGSGSGLRLHWTAPENDGGTPILRYVLRFTIPNALGSKESLGAASIDSDYGDATGDAGSFTGGTRRRGSSLSAGGFHIVQLPGAGTSTVLKELPDGLGWAARTPLRHISVCAVNAVGVGPASNRVSHVGASKPASAPQRLMLGDVPADCSCVPLRWDPPSLDGGSPILGYVVRYRLGSMDVFAKHRTCTTSTQYTVEGLPHPAVPVTDISVCAYTAVGEGEWSRPLAITVPRPPTHVHTGLIRRSSVAFTWAPSHVNVGAPLTGYAVYVSTNGSPFVRRLVGVEPGCTVDITTPGASIVVRVAGVNALGEGDMSRVCEAVAPADGAPTGVHVVSTTRDSVTLQWARAITAAPVQAYAVTYTLDGVAKEATTADSRVTIAGLHADATIADVRVAAITSHGRGPESSPIGPLSPLRVPAAPHRITVSEVTSDAITVAWRSSHSATGAGGRAPTGYRVKFSGPSGVERVAEMRDPSAREAHVTGLGAGCALRHLRVVAFNDAGESPACGLGDVVTTHAPPCAPQHVRVTATDCSSVTVEWDAVPHELSGGMPVTSYRLLVTVDGTTFQRQFSPRELSWRVEGLDSDTPVDNIRVCAVNQAGCSPFGGGAQIHARTVAVRPSPPQRPRLRQALRESHQLVVMWHHPDFPAGAERRGGGAGATAVASFEVQWALTTASLRSAATSVSPLRGGGGVAASDAQPQAAAQTWKLAQSVRVEAQRSNQWQFATVTTRPNRCYDFRVRACNADGVCSAWSPTSTPIFLKAPIPPRPTRVDVPPLPTDENGHVMATAQELKAYVMANIDADAAYDTAMRAWLRQQGWGALRTWAWLSRALSFRQLAEEAMRISQPRRHPRASRVSTASASAAAAAAVATVGAGGASAAPSTAPRLSAFVMAGRRKWVHLAQTAAFGRPHLMDYVPMDGQVLPPALAAEVSGSRAPPRRANVAAANRAGRATATAVSTPGGTRQQHHRHSHSHRHQNRPRHQPHRPSQRKQQNKKHVLHGPTQGAPTTPGRAKVSSFRSAGPTTPGAPTDGAAARVGQRAARQQPKASPSTRPATSGRIQAGAARTALALHTAKSFSAGARAKRPAAGLSRPESAWQTLRSTPSGKMDAVRVHIPVRAVAAARVWRSNSERAPPRSIGSTGTSPQRIGKPQDMLLASSRRHGWSHSVGSGGQ